MVPIGRDFSFFFVSAYFFMFLSYKNFFYFLSHPYDLPQIPCQKPGNPFCRSLTDNIPIVQDRQFLSLFSSVSPYFLTASTILSLAFCIYHTGQTQLFMV